MSPLKRYVWMVLGYNLLAGVVLLLPFLFLRTGDGAVYWGFFLLLIAALSLSVQLVVGIVFAIGTRKRPMGQALLLSVGIILLVGLSVCGAMVLSL